MAFMSLFYIGHWYSSFTWAIDRIIHPIGNMSNSRLSVNEISLNFVFVFVGAFHRNLQSSLKIGYVLKFRRKKSFVIYTVIRSMKKVHWRVKANKH